MILDRCIFGFQQLLTFHLNPATLCPTQLHRTLKELDRGFKSKAGFCLLKHWIYENCLDMGVCGCCYCRPSRRMKEEVGQVRIPRWSNRWTKASPRLDSTTNSWESWGELTLLNKGLLCERENCLGKFPTFPIFYCVSNSLNEYASHTSHPGALLMPLTRRKRERSALRQPVHQTTLGKSSKKTVFLRSGWP